MADTIQDQATTIQTAYQASLKKIQTDTTLSAVGKQALIAAAYIGAKDKLDALSAGQTATGQNRRDTLERTVFGLPASANSTDISSYRDAFDRLSKLNPADPTTGQQVTTMLANAKRSGDSILTKAVLSYAFDTRNADLVNQVIADQPTWEDNVEELWSIVTAPLDLLSAWSFIVNKPTELQSIDEVQIRALAKKKPVTVDDVNMPATSFTNASY